MHLVLIQPPIEDFYTTAVRLQPIGLAYLKAAVKARFPEVNVTIRDYHHGHGRYSVAWPKELGFLKAYYPVADRSPFSTFYHYFHFGASWQTIVEDVARLNPDLVGISALFSAYAPQALHVARLLKKHLQVPVLMGGSHVSAVPQEVLNQPYVDFVIYGEGERALVELVEAWLGNKNYASVANLGFKEGGQQHFNALKENFPPDEIPFPDFSDFDPQTYRHAGRPLCFMVSSRSCPYRCSFCSVHQTFGTHFRLRSVENIMEELRLRWEQGYRAFDFEDDNLTFDQKRMRLLTRYVQNEFAARDVRLMAMNGVAYFRLDPDLLEQMHAAGFRDLNISLVSRNEALLRRLRRPYHFEKFERVVHTAARLNMSVVSYQILGLPGDTLDSMLETLIYQSRLPLTIGVSPFYYTPKMPIGWHDYFEKPYWVLGRLTSLGLSKNRADRDAVYTLFILSRMINFLKQLSGVEQDVSLGDLLESQKNRSGKERLGLQILQRLLKEKRLFAFTGKEFFPLERFQYALFQSFVQKVGFVRRPDGTKINLQ